MSKLVELEAQIQLKYRLVRAGLFQIGGRDFSAQEIIKTLAPHLTESRRKRIDEVILGRTFSMATVAEHLYDIGNVSAVMRSAESFGFLPFHVIERPGAKYKMSDRISRGTEKWLDIHRHIDAAAAFENLRQQGFKIYATDLNATHRLQDIDFTNPVAVVFGNEKEGISDFVRKNADGTFKIPMYGFAQSYNISVAAALSFFHIHAAREKALKKSGDLLESEQLCIRAQYYMRTLDSFEDILLRFHAM